MRILVSVLWSSRPGCYATCDKFDGCDSIFSARFQERCFWKEDREFKNCEWLALNNAFSTRSIISLRSWTSWQNHTHSKMIFYWCICDTCNSWSCPSAPVLLLTGDSHHNGSRRLWCFALLYRFFVARMLRTKNNCWHISSTRKSWSSRNACWTTSTKCKSEADTDIDEHSRNTIDSWETIKKAKCNLRVKTKPGYEEQ